MKILTIIVVTMIGIVLSGADLFDENRALKTGLAEQQKQLQPLHMKNQQMEIQIAALDTTNQLVSGEIKTPPKEVKKKETVIWDFKMESREEYYGNNGYPKFAENVKDGSISVLRIVGEEKKSNCLIKYFSTADFEKIKGRKITCMIMVKGENIEGKGAVKFMLMVGLPDKKTDWPDAQIGQGSFDWRSVSFSYDVPIDAKGIAMMIGLQGPTGTVYFKDLKVEVLEK